MPLKIGCPCGKRLRVRDDQAGKRVKCPVCSAKIVLPGAAPPSAPPPGADEAVAMLNRRLSAQAGSPPIASPRKETPLAAQPGRTTPGHVMPNNALKLEPADGDIPIAGDVPVWGSGPKLDAPSAESAPPATP